MTGKFFALSRPIAHALTVVCGATLAFRVLDHAAFTETSPRPLSSIGLRRGEETAGFASFATASPDQKPFSRNCAG